VGVTGVSVGILATLVGVFMGGDGTGRVTVWVAVEDDKVLGIGSGCLAQLGNMEIKIIHTKSTTINLKKLCFIKYPPATQKAR
jgi:hypothetical protein